MTPDRTPDYEPTDRRQTIGQLLDTGTLHIAVLAPEEAAQLAALFNRRNDR